MEFNFSKGSQDKFCQLNVAKFKLLFTGNRVKPNEVIYSEILNLMPTSCLLSLLSVLIFSFPGKETSLNFLGGGRPPFLLPTS